MKNGAIVQVYRSFNAKSLGFVWRWNIRDIRTFEVLARSQKGYWSRKDAIANLKRVGKYLGSTNVTGRGNFSQNIYE